MRKLLIAMGVVAVLAPAPAHALSLADPDDSASRLDIKELRVKKDGDVGTFVIETYGRWKSSFLKDARPTALKWLFDSGYDGATDVVGNFRYKADALRLFMKSKTGDVYEPVVAVRPNRRTVKVKFNVDILGAHLGAAARSVSSDLADCPGDPCRDRAPGSGSLHAW